MIFVLDIRESHSSLISKIEFDDELGHLTVYFRSYYLYSSTHEGVRMKEFEEFAKQVSIGKFYLDFIKPNFKQVNQRFMAKERPKTINKASDDVRYLDISIDVQKIIKEWIYAGEKGSYLHLRLRMLPDGKVDNNGNLGFVSQKMPKDVREARKAQGMEGNDLRGPILGNACEFEPFKNEGQPGSESGERISEEGMDDLPF